MPSADDVAQATGKNAAEVTDVLDGLMRKGSVIGVAGYYGLPGVPLLVNLHGFTETTGPHDVEVGRLYTGAHE